MGNNPITRLGLSSGVVQTALERYWGGGQILWVGNRSGLPAGNGASSDRPLSALFGTNGALARLNGTTNRGHVIFTLPGHAESVSAADAASATGAASTFAVVGLGRGTARPAFTWTAAAATWAIDTANVNFDNLQLNLAGPHAAGTAITVASALPVTAAGFGMRKCDVRCGFDVDQILTVGIYIQAPDAIIEDNRFIGLAAAEITAAGTLIRLDAAHRTIIQRNWIEAALATDTDGLIETLDNASLSLDINNNFLYANGSGNTCAVDFGAALACTGRLQNNLMVVDADGTAQTVVFTRHATANMALQDNNLVNDNNERGLVIGTASA